ncbi:glycosyltransferase [Streptomyces antimicrobicus]|uniref:D-inositol 3-phosphate glycosyltransferase n=1 Tax=Streptomyces antimicrobicus TaxID=2883108 RepID=A0ABS8B1J5_9ACTN|nr:glycosyltransferase [Streptomyces antimicrobicus]MCB5178480.1 glycosyltransferase [Streptomyces antimicrobicus]
MDISALRNPYDYRNPVRDAAVFAGRDGEVAAIRYELDQAAVDRPSVCVVLHGQRMAGKTSLLNATEWLARERGFVSVRLELVAGDGAPGVFFRRLYEELVVAVAAAGVAVDVAEVRRVMAGAAPAGPGARLEFPEAVALFGDEVSQAALRADLATFVRLLGRPLVLLVDEAQLVADDVRVLSVLRFLMSRVDGLVLVLAGTSELIGRITEVHSPLLRQFKEIEVKRFVEVEDVRNCVLRPLRALGLDSVDENGAVAALMYLTDGNPYEVQLYCHEMFARWQQGAAPGMLLTSDVLDGIRSRLESGRDLDRPLIRAVRAMERTELIAFNVMASALGHTTADEAWFAYCLTGPPEITRESYDRCREELVAAGVLAEGEVVRFAMETELFDEMYVRLWTVGRLGESAHPQLAGRGTARALLVNRLLALLEGIAPEGMRIFPTCCHAVRAGHVASAVRALRELPPDGPDGTPHINFLHAAVLRAGGPRALDLTTVTCSFGGHSVQRWLYAADTAELLLEGPAFRAAAERIAGLGGELTTARVRIPLDTWPATEWFRRATGALRAELADNHLQAAYAAYDAGEGRAARGHLRESFELAPGWEPANDLAYVCLADGGSYEALEWAGRAVDLAGDGKERALSRYNLAMACLLTGRRAEALDHLARAAGELAAPAPGGWTVGYLHLPELTDGGTGVVLREHLSVDVPAAVARARALLGAPEAAGAAAGSTESTGPTALVAVTAAGAAVTAGGGAVTAAGGAGAAGGAAGAGAAAGAAADTAAAPRATVVLVVATEWVSRHGGLSSFNRNLCAALAAAGARVFCVVLEASAEEAAAARAAGVVLLPAPRRPGEPDGMRLSARPALPPGMVVDLVVGHGRITGPAARRLAEDFFPAARRLHFVHMAPDEIEWYKPDRERGAAARATERTGLERALGRSAHRVVTVGPRLHEQFLPEFGGVREPLRLDPGFDPGPGDPAPAEPASAAPRGDGPRTPPGGRLRVLLFGRAEDERLKGLDLAAAACGRVAGYRADDGLPAFTLVVRGAPEDTADAQHSTLSELAAETGLKVVVRPYSADQEDIAGDLAAASLVLVPSRAEGFGLVGVEAIVQGVPVLVSSESGLADLLREVLDAETAARFVVPVSGNDAKDTDRWARAVDRVLRDREGAFAQVAQLRSVMAARVTWAGAARTLLAEAAPADAGAGAAPAATAPA